MKSQINPASSDEALTRQYNLKQYSLFRRKPWYSIWGWCWIKFKIISMGALMAIIFFAWPAVAAEFDPNYLISDAEMTNYNTMDLPAIQRFLDRREGTLKNYITIDKENNFKTAIQTFYEVAQKWLINPKYLLVLVQKEMSLLTDPSPSQGQYDWATGYGCPDSGGCDDRWRGFYKQVNSAAAQTRYYMDNINEFNYQPNKTATVDNTAVTPKNTATAGLYNYTPHLHGNQLFWELWNKYFGKKWPDGSLLQSTSTEQTYLISGGQKREIMSKAVLLSRFDLDKVIQVNSDDLSYYEDGVPVKFYNFSLLRNPAGDIYLIVDDQKRKIQNKEVFKKIGFQEEEVDEVSDIDLSIYKNGADITEFSIYPAGILLQDVKTKAIYYIISGKKQLVANQEILDANFHGLPIKKAMANELDNYYTGDLVTLPDGGLIKVKKVNTVYVISNGKRLPIFNSDIFKKMNYKWNNVIIVSEETLNIHPLGQTITGDW
ncbi:hypothetical protein HZA71_01150 [Candidatus Falkowbacteria bacterium]|nr:hypothetical protein [Candidatus Falkowbacteria bacterium]